MKASRKISDEEVIARAERAMQRASDKAMEDYKRFGIEPVIAPFRKKGETPESVKK